MIRGAGAGAASPGLPNRIPWKLNELLHRTLNRRTTQAAEGHRRWSWKSAEFVRLTELGAFTAEDRFELIGGEIVQMSPVGRRHEVLVPQLVLALAVRLADLKLE